MRDEDNRLVLAGRARISCLYPTIWPISLSASKLPIAPNLGCALPSCAVLRRHQQSGREGTLLLSLHLPPHPTCSALWVTEVSRVGTPNRSINKGLL